MWKFFVVVVLTTFGCTSSQETNACKCVTYYICNRDGTIIDDGEGLFSERLGGCTCQCAAGEVCCRLKNATIALETQIPCGVRNPNGVGFKGTAGGDEVNFGEFPWVVDILVDSDAFTCGGSLIRPNVVLTAAHCVRHKKNYIVRAGEWDSSGTNEILKHQDIRASSIKIHANYSPAVYYNDIALVFLNESFALTSYVQTVCLPESNANIGTDRCYVVGRGKDSAGKYRPIPKRIDLPIVNKETCETQIRATKIGKNFNLYRSFLCAGGEKDKDACIGDGGAALVCPLKGEEERYEQIGIVSWGVGCHQEGVPGVYSNVPFLREWIDKELEAKNIK